jgi:hypothetical protein
MLDGSNVIEKTSKKLKKIGSYKLPAKSYCDVITSVLYKYLNKITDSVEFNITKDYYTAIGKYIELEDKNYTYKIRIEVVDKVKHNQEELDEK